MFEFLLFEQGVWIEVDALMQAGKRLDMGW